MGTTPRSTVRRGAHVLDAVSAVLADDGLASLSMRTVAQRAGVSPAQVQYYFRTRDELVRAAFDHVGDAFLAELAVLPAADEPSLAALRATIMLWLPLDGTRERRARVWLAYTAAAVVDPVLAADAARFDAELRTWCAGHLDQLDRTGAIRSGLDHEERAGALLALVDGLVLHALVVPAEHRAELVVGPLDGWLDDLRP